MLWFKRNSRFREKSSWDWNGREGKKISKNSSLQSNLPLLNFQKFILQKFFHHDRTLCIKGKTFIKIELRLFPLSLSPTSTQLPYPSEQLPFLFRTLSPLIFYSLHFPIYSKWFTVSDCRGMLCYKSSFAVKLMSKIRDMFLCVFYAITCHSEEKGKRIENVFQALTVIHTWNHHLAKAHSLKKMA